MSIYSGFATRQQQQSYDECLETVLYIMQKRLMRFYKGQPTDEDKFISLLNKMHSQMKSMESHKYLEPKSSRTFEQLLIFLKNKQLEEASMVPNRIAEVEQISDSELHKKLPLPKEIRQVQTEQPQGKSQRLQVKFNEHNLADKQQQVRPNTTNNRIRKRTSSKSNSSNSNAYQSHYINSKQKKSQADAQSNNEVQKIQKLKLNNLISQSATKLIKASRNQPRTYFNSSHQQLANRNMSQRSKGKESEEQVEQLNINLTGRQSDVHQLIKGYINKTKKSYLKGFNRRKQQIQEMLKQV